MMFFLNERSDLFVSAGLYRTARRIWSDLLAERYGLELDRQPPMVLMSYAHGLETADEPLVNVARGAVSITGAVLGGVEYLCAAAYDEALRTPSLDAAALALRTMQVVCMEHGVAASLDPLEGSVKMAHIEEKIDSTVRTHLNEILDRGGAIACIHSGYAASLLDDGRGRREGQLERRERAWVGVNSFVDNESRDLFRGASVATNALDEIEKELAARVAKHRNDHSGALRELDTVVAAAAGDDNIMPATITALRAGATTQQIVEATSRGFRDRR
jgi:methylmalonyl-CoA mutase N-terminal domain/subunit